MLLSNRRYRPRIRATPSCLCLMRKCAVLTVGLRRSPRTASAKVIKRREIACRPLAASVVRFWPSHRFYLLTETFLRQIKSKAFNGKIVLLATDFTGDTQKHSAFFFRQRQECNFYLKIVLKTRHTHTHTRVKSDTM